MRKRWAMASAVGIVVVLGIVATLALLDRSDGEAPLADPEDVELPPPPANVDPLRSYLETEGAAIVTFHRAVAAFAEGADEVDQSDCQDFVRSELEPAAQPVELGKLMSLIDDPDATSLLQDHLIVSMDFLSSCSDGDAPDPEGFQFSAVVVGRYFEEIGVT